ncbi:MAG: CheR family methyltransferase [Polyangiaceae bacterium]
MSPVAKGMGAIKTSKRERSEVVASTSRGVDDAAEILAPTLTDEQFAAFTGLAEEWTGVRLGPHKRAMLLARIGMRLRRLRLSSVSAYLKYLTSAQGKAEEKEHFIDVVTTHHTSFFREQDHFSVLSKDVLGSYGKSSDISVLSAACSTGEEVWTIGMTLAHTLGNLRFKLTGTDISQRALQTARRAVYPEETVSTVPEPLRNKWLMRSRERDQRLVRVVPELRERATFFRVNLTNADGLGLAKYDVIFLRNVLIYFEREAQRRILGRLLSHVNSRGWLFVGLSETADGFDLPIRRVAHSVYRRTS